MPITQERGRDVGRGVVGPVAVEEVRVLVFYRASGDTGRWGSSGSVGRQRFFNLDRDEVTLLVPDVLKGTVAPGTFLLASGAIQVDFEVVIVNQVLPKWWGRIFSQVPLLRANFLGLPFCCIDNLKIPIYYGEGIVFKKTCNLWENHIFKKKLGGRCWELMGWRTWTVGRKVRLMYGG